MQINKDIYYIKSLEEDFCTKTLKGAEKINYQSIFDIVKRKIIKPNTKSFGRVRRLSCTILSENYLKTYRPQGVIFQTEDKPEYIFPFDLVLLSATEKIVVHYYRIKNNLHVYYNHTLIPGFEAFMFKDFISMAKKYPSPEKAWEAVNRFRIKNGFNKLPRQKYRLVEYNEAVYHNPVKIKPVAIFGYRKETSKIAEKLNLPHYVSAKHFYKHLKNE
jgi:hypothetical protein